MKDLHHNIALVATLLPQIVQANQTGIGVSAKGFGSVEHLIHLGAPGDTLSGSLKFDFALEESDVLGSGYTAVTAADAVLGTTPAAGGIFATVDANGEASQIYRIGYRGNKEFSRVTITKTGTHTNGTPISMLAIKGHPHLMPTA